MSNKNKNYNYILIPLLSIGLFMYSIWCGFGYTGDSYMYEEISQSFVKDGLGGFNNPWLGNKPPLLSIIIFLVGSNQILFFNLVCFIIVIWFSYRLCLTQLNDPIIKGLAILIISFGLPIYLVNNFLWSEPLFNVCVIFLFYLLQLPAISRKQWLTIIVISNVMLLMRHAGIFILIGLFVSRFIFMEHKSKWIAYFAMFTLCSLGSIVWFLFAPSSGAAWTEEIVSVNLLEKVSHNFYMLTHGFSLWFLPMVVPFLGRLVILLLLFSALWVWLRKHKVLSKSDLTWILASLIYIGFLHGVYEMPIEDGERYFSPLFPVLFLVFFKVFDKALLAIRQPKFKYVILIVLLCWSIYPIFRTFKNAHFWHTLRCEEKVVSSSGVADTFKN